MGRNWQTLARGRAWVVGAGGCHRNMKSWSIRLPSGHDCVDAVCFFFGMTYHILNFLYLLFLQPRLKQKLPGVSVGWASSGMQAVRRAGGLVWPRGEEHVGG